jgi:hypothetical protein
MGEALPHSSPRPPPPNRRPARLLEASALFLSFPATGISFPDRFLSDTSPTSPMEPGQSGSRAKRDQRPKYVRDQHGNLIDPQVVRQREADDARMVAAAKQKRLDERNKKAKFDHVTKLKDLTKQEYREFRHRKYYSMPKDNMSTYFWRSKHEMIFKEVYAPMSTKVCPMKYIDIDLLFKDEYFRNALWVTENMGLHKLMAIKQAYCPNLIQQFFATLEFDN